MCAVKIVIGVAILTAAAPAIIAQSPDARGATTNRAAAKGAGSANPSAAVGLLPGTKANVFPTIRGNALTSTNVVLPNTVVRLRDVRYGRIVDTQVTDNAGTFTFTTLDPGSYIVEVMSTDRTVLAASDIIHINAGEAVTAIVKLPFRVPPLAGVFGNSVTSAATVAAEAAASGVLAVTVSGAPASDRPIS
jgi:hypothetical protein